MSVIFTSINIDSINLYHRFNDIHSLFTRYSTSLKYSRLGSRQVMSTIHLISFVHQRIYDLNNSNKYNTNFSRSLIINISTFSIGINFRLGSINVFHRYPAVSLFDSQMLIFCCFFFFIFEERKTPQTSDSSIPAEIPLSNFYYPQDSAPLYGVT